MNITLKSLKRIISEVMVASTKTKANRQVNLSELKKLDRKAYDGWVEMMIEDCDINFVVSPNGKITAYDPAESGPQAKFDPSKTVTTGDVGMGWESPDNETRPSR